MVGLPDDAFFFHAFHDGGGPIVAYLQAPLDIRRRGLAVAFHDRHRLLIKIATLCEAQPTTRPTTRGGGRQPRPIILGPDDKPAFDEPPANITAKRDVPHGKLELIEYESKTVGTNRKANVSNNPDALAVLWTSLETGKVRYVAHEGRELEIEGSPDWILEIVSDGSVFKDTVQLRKAYHRAGVDEYWLFDARGTDVDFQILHWRKNGYWVAPVQGGWLRSRVFGRNFRLTRKRDRRGGWKYTLAVKPT